MALDDPDNPVAYDIYFLVRGEEATISDCLQMEDLIQTTILELLKKEFPQNELVLMGIDRPPREDKDG